MHTFHEEILATRSDLYVIAIGTNDIRYRNPKNCAMTAEEYIADLEELTALIQTASPEARIVFIAPWMTLEVDSISSLTHEEKNEMTDHYSRSLCEYAAAHNFYFIDANPYLRDYFENAAWLLYTKDGIHPNATVGIALYAQAVLESSN